MTNRLHLTTRLEAERFYHNLDAAWAQLFAWNECDSYKDVRVNQYRKQLEEMLSFAAEMIEGQIE